MTEQEKREKVIKELECCISLNHNGSKCANCDYADEFHNGDCETYLLSDALTMLKAQEPVTVIPAIKKNDELLTEGSCPICGAKLDYYLNGQFCGCCGGRLKWE